MHSHIYDVIVIGAGGMGSASAYHLAKNGANVLVLEQFNRGHIFGSSHGETRIIRFFYDKPFYTELMKTAYTEWRSLESESDKQLLFITGSINLGKKGNHYTTAVSESLDEAGVNYEWWDTKQLAKRFPQFRVPNIYDILWQKDTGFLYASECVLTHLQLAERHGAIVRENTPVKRIDWQTDVPTIHTDTNQYIGRKVVVTSGAWTSSLLSDLESPTYGDEAAGVLFQNPLKLRCFNLTIILSSQKLLQMVNLSTEYPISEITVQRLHVMD